MGVSESNRVRQCKLAILRYIARLNGEDRLPSLINDELFYGLADMQSLNFFLSDMATEKLLTIRKLITGETFYGISLLGVEFLRRNTMR